MFYSCAQIEQLKQAAGNLNNSQPDNEDQVNEKLAEVGRQWDDLNDKVSKAIF